MLVCFSHRYIKWDGKRSSAKVSRCRLDCYCDYERPQENDFGDLENVDVMSLDVTDKNNSKSGS